jgi:hypothetical protein
VQGELAVGEGAVEVAHDAGALLPGRVQRGVVDGDLVAAVALAGVQREVGPAQRARAAGRQGRHADARGEQRGSGAGHRVRGA